MVEGTGLENRHTVTRYREFESLPVRFNDESAEKTEGAERRPEFAEGLGMPGLFACWWVDMISGRVAEWFKAHAWKVCVR